MSHEFVYLQGGHMTPDGFYGPGDHIVSLPEVKEGPYLSCLNPLKTAYPNEWPMYVSENLIRREIQEPWPKIFDGSRDGIYGVLFVHYGPFATLARLWRPANWTILSAHELGPLG